MSPVICANTSAAICAITSSIPVLAGPVLVVEGTLAASFRGSARGACAIGAAGVGIDVES
jgi:hypothetical protein